MSISITRRKPTFGWPAALGLALAMISTFAPDASAQYRRGGGFYGRGYGGYGGARFYGRGYGGYAPRYYNRGYAGYGYGPRVYNRGYYGFSPYGVPYASPYVAPFAAPGYRYGFGYGYY